LLAPYERSLADLAEQIEDPEPLPLLDDAARARLLSTLAALVLDFARERPLFFVVDDLQWADELSLDLLSLMTAQDCAKAPLLLLGTCRIEEMPAPLDRLIHEPGTIHAQIDRMGKAELGQMVGGMLALHKPPAALVEFLYAESSGNPFFLAEYLRTAIAEGRLERNAEGRWVLSNSPLASVAVPTAISELIRRRLDGLDPKSRRIVGAAAVLGRGFDAELLARTVGCDLSEVLDAYGTLRQRQILEDDQTGVVRFVHDQLRDTAYSAIDVAERTRWHQRAAAAIEACYVGPELDPYLAALGFHLAKAGTPDRAAVYFERAADLARRTYANGDAVKLYRLAIAQIDATSSSWGDKARARATLHEAVGDLLLMTGDAPAAREAFDAALADSADDQPVERGRRLRKCARTWERQHQHSRALEVFARAETQLGDTLLAEDHGASWWREWVQVQVDKTWDFYWLAKVDELSRLVERVRPVVEERGEPSQRAQFYQALVHTALRRERYARLEEAIEYGRRSLAAAEQCEDPRELALARFFLAFPLLCAGKLEESEPLFVAAIDVADRIGDTTLQARFLSYYAVLHRRAGRVEQTRAVAERAAGIAERGNMFDYVGVSHACLAWAAWKGGMAVELNRHADICLAAWGRLLPAYDYPLHWLVRMPLAAQFVADGAIDQAIEQWQALLKPTQHLLPESLRDAMEYTIAAIARLEQDTALPIVQLAAHFGYL
jgi:tetratricopeptide (TPR) repeat protein